LLWGEPGRSHEAGAGAELARGRRLGGVRLLANSPGWPSGSPPTSNVPVTAKVFRSTTAIELSGVRASARVGGTSFRRLEGQQELRSFFKTALGGTFGSKRGTNWLDVCATRASAACCGVNLAAHMRRGRGEGAELARGRRLWGEPGRPHEVGAGTGRLRNWLAGLAGWGETTGEQPRRDRPVRRPRRCGR
jgi:hypothetical protein